MTSENTSGRANTSEPRLPSPHELVALLGGHPASALGFGPDPENDAELGAWWTLVCLLDTRRAGEAGEVSALAAWRALAGRSTLQPGALACTGSPQLAIWLEEVGHPRAEAVAAVLCRGGQRLADAYDGSLSRLARECEDLEQLSATLAKLSPGFGRASVMRFLQPLREGWPAAAELPLDAAASAAAVHLGWHDEGDDPEAGPGTLRARLARHESAPLLHDVEAALSRLGRRSCLRERSDRCPLGGACPAR